jgi:trehalose utilization protein
LAVNPIGNNVGQNLLKSFNIKPYYYVGEHNLIPRYSRSEMAKILSNRHEGALLPVESANGIASLSTYPSAKALELFSEVISGNKNFNEVKK